ncbi:hypothetical protein DSM3645_23965 [Blastopirellula marina DSM 3645]|uniref:Uncharacterized protein n=1 Tax=Blastopirellula marina DSM 3645 TaxID=314230 RepID=A4A1K5_9BACT|nr:hypothetical protein DSM3645_23965 [Blastopirellula marina DSM 3645]
MIAPNLQSRDFGENVRLVLKVLVNASDSCRWVVVKVSKIRLAVIVSIVRL